MEQKILSYEINRFWLFAYIIRAEIFWRLWIICTVCFQNIALSCVITMGREL